MGTTWAVRTPVFSWDKLPFPQLLNAGFLVVINHIFSSGLESNYQLKDWMPPTMSTIRWRLPNAPRRSVSSQQLPPTAPTESWWKIQPPWSASEGFAWDGPIQNGMFTYMLNKNQQFLWVNIDTLHGSCGFTETRLDKELRGDGKKLNQGWDLPQKITEGSFVFWWFFT